MPLAGRSRLVRLAAASGLFVLLMAHYNIGISGWVAFVPILVLLLVLFTLGVTLTTSAVNVFYRDVSPVVQSACSCGVLTPVCIRCRRSREKHAVAFC